MKILTIDKRVGEEDIRRIVDMHLHVGLYAPVVFGARATGAHLAVVDNGMDVANTKYSDWVGMRKPLEKLRPPSATELLFSNDGDQILEGCLTKNFVICRKTAPISDGVLPGVVREVVLEVCLEIGIPIREVAPSWSGRSIYYKWLEALQHVETNRVPSSCHSLGSKTWKEITWQEKQFKDGPGSITMTIQEEVMKRAKLGGYTIASFVA